MKRILKVLRWALFSFVAKRWPEALPHYPMLKEFVVRWVTAAPQERTALIEWAFTAHVLSTGKVVHPVMIEAFRLYGGIQNSFRLVWKRLPTEERERNEAAMQKAFATQIHPHIDIDIVSSGVIAVAGVMNVLPDDLLGTLEGLEAARAAGSATPNL